MDEAMRSVFDDVARVLRWQEELGLEGLERLPTDWLEFPPAIESDPALESLPEKDAQQRPALPWESRSSATTQSSTTRQPAAAPSLEELKDIDFEGSNALALEAVRTVLGDCTRCPLHRGRTQIVFGTGSPEARLMFIGEGPGRDEDLQGEPFVGKGGQLLTRMIGAMGLRRADVYIANIVKCRPPRNRDPEPEEVAACEAFLISQIRAIRPEIIVTLGKYATQTLLRVETPISRLRGQWKSYDGIPLMPTFHPAYLLRNPAEKRPVWSDLQAVMARLGLEAPS